MEGIIPRDSVKLNRLGVGGELKALCEISKAVQEADISQASFETILKSVGGVIDFRSASLFMFSGETGKLDEICTIGHRVDLIDFVEFDMGSGISAWVAQKRRPILLNNLRKSKGGVHIRSFLSVPIVYGNEIKGVINLAHDESEAFTHRDSDVLGIVSTLFALLMERIHNRRFESCAKAEIDALNEQLDKTRIEMSKMESTGGNANFIESLSRKIANPLAIIAGNAQFLLMTMKNSSSSVIRRLKAIDKEASNIIALTNNNRPGSYAERENGVESDVDYRPD
jgi:transcriptional regulator with GAF, ATPase, and Fis domain